MPAISFTAYLALLPAKFLRWWFLEATFNLLKILEFILTAFFHFLSIDLIFKTFFQPWKNEYREDLVRFARFMGIFIKSTLLVFDLVFLIGLVFLEGIFFVFWVALPFVSIWGIYVFLFTR